MRCFGLAGKWHNEVVKILRELCEQHMKTGYYKKVCDGISDPIPISYKMQTYYYHPDLYSVYKSDEKIDVYEVIDTETDGEIVMDIVSSALTPRINALCVVCSNESKLDDVKKYAKIILNKIFDDNKKPYSNIYRPKYFMYIPKDTRFTKKTILSIKRRLAVEMEFKP
jgi:hypothetical protein